MEHMRAMYVYGIILLCKGSELNEKEDLHLLNVVKKSTSLEECKGRAKSFILIIWVINHSLKYQELKICCVKTCYRNTKISVGKDRSDPCF